MTNADLHIKAMDVLFNMYTAIKNVQLYEVASPIITNSVERFYMHLQDVLKQESPLIFKELEKQVMLQKNILNEKEQNSTHVLYLLDILRNFGLQGIHFDKGVQREELHDFVMLLGKNPKAVHFSGGISKLMRNNKIVHIHSEKRTYTFNDKHEESPQTVAGNSQSLESILQSSEDPITNVVSEMIKVSSRLGEMDGKIESATSKEQRDLINTLSEPVIEWLKIKTSATPDYKNICQSIENILKELIKWKFFAEAIPMMNVLSDINNGVLQKDDKTRAVSSDVFRNLASENNINILIKEHRANESDKKFDAGQILTSFGDIIVNKLLDTIRDSSDSKERVRLIHLIEDIGQETIPSVKERINMNAPWYFLRNLAYILGRIGNETSADILQPLLLHKDKRVRTETLKSLIQTGGHKKGPILLSALPQADQDFRMNIIETLGKIRYADAVPELLDMLKSKSSMDKEKQIVFQEIICNALGAIGSPKAIPVLSEITESKSFLGISSYPVETKYAAKRALASIQRKQEENKH